MKTYTQEELDQEVAKVLRPWKSAKVDDFYIIKELKAELTQQQSVNSRLVEALKDMIDIAENASGINPVDEDMIFKAKSALSSIPSTINQKTDEKDH